MNKIANIARRFREEEDGAALIEYSVLIGIITVAAIATIIGVGTWVSTQWSTLCTDLSSSSTACTPA